MSDFFALVLLGDPKLDASVLTGQKAFEIGSVNGRQERILNFKLYEWMTVERRKTTHTKACEIRG